MDLVKIKASMLSTRQRISIPANSQSFDSGAQRADPGAALPTQLQLHTSLFSPASIYWEARGPGTQSLCKNDTRRTENADSRKQWQALPFSSCLVSEWHCLAVRPGLTSSLISTPQIHTRGFGVRLTTRGRARGHFTSVSSPSTAAHDLMTLYIVTCSGKITLWLSPGQYLH